MTYNPGQGPYNYPQVTISDPLTGPPEQLTTAAVGPTIFGNLDGINNLFQTGIAVPLYQVWRNGVLQTNGVDVVTGPTVILFLKGAIPQPGDTITAQAFGTF